MSIVTSVEEEGRQGGWVLRNEREGANGGRALSGGRAPGNKREMVLFHIGQCDIQEKCLDNAMTKEEAELKYEKRRTTQRAGGR